MSKDIYELKLHETMRPDQYTEVMRVASGWLYTVWDGDSYIQTVFVPFDNKFQSA